MSPDHFRTFTAICIAAVLASLLVCFMTFFLTIEIPRMRNETPTQQLYNRCLASQGYSNDAAAKSCEYVLQGKK